MYHLIDKNLISHDSCFMLDFPYQSVIQDSLDPSRSCIELINPQIPKISSDSKFYFIHFSTNLINVCSPSLDIFCFQSYKWFSDSNYRRHNISNKDGLYVMDTFDLECNGIIFKGVVYQYVPIENNIVSSSNLIKINNTDSHISLYFDESEFVYKLTTQYSNQLSTISNNPINSTFKLGV